MTIGYLFSGQGQQFAGMGADLYAQEASYRDVIDQASDILHHDLTTPAVVEDPQLAQANIVAFSVALHRVHITKIHSTTWHLNRTDQHSTFTYAANIHMSIRAVLIQLFLRSNI